MSERLISVIVPVYNTEAYLEKCLDSLVAQTYPNWEAILVDDGSTDRSGEICDEYATNYPPPDSGLFIRKTKASVLPVIVRLRLPAVNM